MGFRERSLTLMLEMASREVGLSFLRLGGVSVKHWMRCLPIGVPACKVLCSLPLRATGWVVSPFFTAAVNACKLLGKELQ